MRCCNSPGSFVVGMMMGHVWDRVNVPDLPTLNLNSSEVKALLGDIVWTSAGDICMWDLLVDNVLVKESGVQATPDLTHTTPGYTIPEELQESLVEIPLPPGVWDRLKELSKTG